MLLLLLYWKEIFKSILFSIAESFEVGTILSLINTPGALHFFPIHKCRGCEGSTVPQHREIYLIMVGHLVETMWYLKFKTYFGRNNFHRCLKYT